jgi:putative adhesin
MKRYLALAGLTLLTSVLVPAQENTGQRVVVPARNSSRPRLLKVNTLHTGITVKTHAGQDVIVESAAPPARAERGRTRERETAPPCMHRIDLPFGGFTVEEEDNVINVRTGPSPGGNLVITVPVNTSAQLRSTHGPIVVDGLHGEVDASCTNGSLDLTNISGTIVAETTNGTIKASMDRVDPAKPISFSSTNGSIEVTLPSDLKANFKMRSFNGSIWSDFEMKLAGGQPVTTSGGADAKFRVKFDRTMYGTVNGGGVDASFSTLNGRILIKKK